jgi:hypothetical protein
LIGVVVASVLAYEGAAQIAEVAPLEPLAAFV